MKPFLKLLLPSILAVNLAADHPASAAEHESRGIVGWTVQINTRLAQEDPAGLATALLLLETQLKEIVRQVPRPAVDALRKVPLWFSPEYANIPPRAEYHPNADWLREHGRNPAMAKGVEFTNVRIFEAETRRMPNFALHELAHAYHDRVVRMGFANLEIKAAYQRAKDSGSYDRVERKDSEGNSRFQKAYAMTNPQEYFAEATEAFFARNDFFPFTLEQLKQHDPQAATLLESVWKVQAKP